MTKEEMIEKLEKMGANFKVCEANDLCPIDMIYVYSKSDLKAQKKDKNHYVSYLRISHFGEDKLYTRYNGLCDWYCDRVVMNWIIEEFL